MTEQPEDPDPQPGGQVPDLEALLHQAQGITPDFLGSVSAMAEMHAQWRRAWQETGAFTEQETFEMTCILVCVSAGGLRSLRLSWGQAASRAGRAQGRAARQEAGCTTSGPTSCTGPAVTTCPARNMDACSGFG
jgi:hypothetical protein